MLRLLRLGAAHATELPAVWGNLVAGSKDPTFKLGGLKPDVRCRSGCVVDGSNFAATGQPSGAVEGTGVAAIPPRGPRPPW